MAMGAMQVAMIRYMLGFSSVFSFFFFFSISSLILVS